MPESLRIEAARPHDAPVLIELVRELARFEKLEHLVESTEAQLRSELAAEPPVIEALIARRGARPVGFAMYFHNFSTFLGRRGLYLEDLYVVPEVRGQGVGRALISHLAGIAARRACGRFEWSVLDWNSRAIDFYRSIGAEVLADWRICRVTGPALARLAGSGAIDGAQ